MTTDHRPSPADTAGVMTQLARSWRNADTMVRTLTLISSYAVDTIPGAQFAGIAVARGKTLVETVAATDDRVTEIDAAQYCTGEGPCLDALWKRQTVRVADITVDERWPRWRDRVQQAGERSMLSFQLFVRDDSLGALNLYADRTDAFGDDDIAIGSVFAGHAAVALADAQEMAGMRAALENRDVIGQAKGVLMQRYHLTPDAAFDLLVRASQTGHVKLHLAARRVVADFTA